MTSGSPLDFALRGLFTADHAEVVNGKLYLNGGCWSRLYFPAYPQVLPSMALVAVVEVPFGLYNADHRFSIGMEDPDHHPLALRVEGNFRVGATPEMEFGDPTVMPLAVPIHNLLLERSGDYSFTVAIDQKELGRYTIRAVQMPVPLHFNIAPPEAPPESAAS